MNSINPMRNYKHDISGKFKDITTALASLDENAFQNPENNEIFHSIHEVLLKMVKTSRNTMIENLQQEIVLVVSDKEVDRSLPKLQIEGVTVRYDLVQGQMEYFLFKKENEGDLNYSIGSIIACLPIRNIRKDDVTKINEAEYGA